MEFESNLTHSLAALEENHYDIYRNVCHFLDQETDFSHNKFYHFSKLPREFWDPKTPYQKLETRLQAICWLGTSLGKDIISKIHQSQSEGTTHIIIEPDLKNFCFFMMLPETASLLRKKNIFWIIGASLDDIPIHFRRLSTTPLISKLISQINFIQTAHYNENYFLKIIDTWNSFFTATSKSSAICAMDEYFGFHNSIANIEALLNAPLIQNFKNRFRGTPGIVVSSGPSLNITLPFIKGLENKALIYCADSSFKILKKAGITPHFTGCFERTGLTKRFLHSTDTFPTTLIASSVVHQNVISSFPNRIIHFLRPHFGLKYFFPNTPTSTISMHSVAHLGLYALWLMGCSPIYLVGQDLAFDPTTKEAHVSGHPYPKEEQPWSTISALNHRGEKVETDVMWVEFAYSLGEIIRRYQIKCYNVIPENYGIQIPNAKRLEPQKSIFDFQQQDQDLLKKIEALTSDHSANTRQMSFHQKSFEIIQTIEQQLPQLCLAFQKIFSYMKAEELSPNSYISLRKSIEPMISTKLDFLTPFMIGKHLDIAKNMQSLPINGTDPIDQWNYLSFLTTLLGHQITSCQLLLKQLRDVTAKLS